MSAKAIIKAILEADDDDDLLKDLSRPSLEDALAVLKEFCYTIDATGGVKDTIDGPVPVADEDWLDLATAYLKACRILGREPYVEEPEPEPDEREWQYHPEVGEAGTVY